jgi:hypothetical protein
MILQKLLHNQNLRAKALSQKIILLTDTHVTYVHTGQKFPLGKEENVRLDYFLKLVFLKFIPTELIAIEFPMRIGTTSVRADIVVRSEENFPPYFLIVECKKPQISTFEFENARLQAISYEKQLNSTFVVVTDGHKHLCLETVFSKTGKSYREISDFPSKNTQFLLFWRLKSWWQGFKNRRKNVGNR